MKFWIQLVIDFFHHIWKLRINIEFLGFPIATH